MNPVVFTLLTCTYPRSLLSPRLAAGAALDEHAPFSVGIPSWLRESSDPGLGRNYFFMHITPASSRKDTARDKADMSLGGDGVLSKHVALTKESGMMLAPRMVHKSPIPDLVLGPLLGKGGYGRVFRGLHKGQEVAVKVGCALSFSLAFLSAALWVCPFVKECVCTV